MTDGILNDYEGLATDAVTELERCLSEHRQYGSRETLDRVKFAASNTASSIGSFQFALRRAEESQPMQAPENRLLLPQATAGAKG